MGLSAQDFVGDKVMIFFTSSIESGYNEEKATGGMVSSIGSTGVRAVATEGSIVSASKLSLIFLIFC